MAGPDLHKQFRQRLNQYPHTEQWLGNHFRRRAKASDRLRNRVIRAVVLGEPEASELNDRIRAANPPSSRVDFFRGIFDTIPSGNARGTEFDHAVDTADSLISTAAFIQSQGPRSVRRLPRSYEVPDFFFTRDSGDVLVQTVNLRRYGRELVHLFDAVAAVMLDHPDLGERGLVVHGSAQYLNARLEGRLRWDDSGSRLVASFDDSAVLEAIRETFSHGQSIVAEGILGMSRSEDPGVHMSWLPPGEQPAVDDHPFFKAIRLEISTNVGWMHNHALANDFHADYQLFLDGTRIDGGLPDPSELDHRLREYMQLMWDTNPKVSAFLKTKTTLLEYSGPGMPTTAM